jgi:prepilin-type N-terminal cleavage/methylation domain-containing protein
MFKSFFDKKFRIYQSFAKYGKKANLSRGFTILELMVSLAIIVIITAVVMFNQNNLSEQISLTNLVSDISLRIRQAQVYGISVKEFNPSASQFSFDTAYGVDFNIGSTNFSNAGYYLFADLNGDGYYDGTYTWSPPACTTGATSECIAWNSLPGGNTITKLCVIPASGPGICTLKRLAITFLRPSPSANMVFWDSTGAINPYTGYLGAEIVVTSPHSLTQTIIVYTTGQISISPTTI